MLGNTWLLCRLTELGYVSILTHQLWHSCVCMCGYTHEHRQKAHLVIETAVFLIIFNKLNLIWFTKQQGTHGSHQGQINSYLQWCPKRLQAYGLENIFAYVFSCSPFSPPCFNFQSMHKQKFFPEILDTDHYEEGLNELIPSTVICWLFFRPSFVLKLWTLCWKETRKHFTSNSLYLFKFQICKDLFSTITWK